MKNKNLDLFFEVPVEEELPGNNVSYSQYSIWMNCPHQWKLNYVDGLYTFDSSIDTVFGSAMHRLIQEWLEMHFKDPKVAKKWDLAPLFKDYLVNEFERTIRTETAEDGSISNIFVCDMNTLQEYYEDGCAIIEHVQKYGKEFFPTKDYRLIGCEIKILMPIREGINFKAYLDIVIHDKRKNEYHIIDLKTSRAGWYKYQKSDPRKLHQLLLYKKYFAKKYNTTLDQIHPRFIILKRKIKENADFIIRRISKFEPAHGKVSMNKMNKSWDTFLNECFSETGEHVTESIKATPSESACKYCPFNGDESLCEYSHAVQKRRNQKQNKRLASK